MTTSSQQLAGQFRQALAIESNRSGAAAARVLREAASGRGASGLSSRYTAAVLALIEDGRNRTARLGGNYYLADRRAQGVIDAVPEVVYAHSLPVQQATASVMFTGPVTITRALSQGASLEQAVRTAELTTYGAVQRHVANGARETVHATALEDPRAIGWSRMSDGRPCAFCAMLVSRGPVYKSAASASMASTPTGRYHDHCGCFVVPMYDRDAPWPGMGERFRGLWEQSTANAMSEREARNAFARAYRRYYPPGSNPGQLLAESYRIAEEAALRRARIGGVGVDWKGLPPPMPPLQPRRESFHSEAAYRSVRRSWETSRRQWEDNVLEWRRANGRPAGLTWTDDPADTVAALMRGKEPLALVDGVTLTPAVPSDGYAVAVTQALDVDPKARNLQDTVRAFASEHADDLAEPGAFLTARVDPETGHYAVSVTRVVDTIDEAREETRKRRRGHVIDLSSGTAADL